MNYTGNKGKGGRKLTFCNDKKEKEIFLICKEIQTALVAKSYIRKGFPIYEEMGKYFTIYMMRLLVMYDFATDPF